MTSIDGHKKSPIETRFPSHDEAVRIRVSKSEFLISAIRVQEPLKAAVQAMRVTFCAGMGGGNVERVRVTVDVWPLGFEIVFHVNDHDGGGGGGGSGGSGCGDSTGERSERETGHDVWERMMAS